MRSTVAYMTTAVLMRTPKVEHNVEQELFTHRKREGPGFKTARHASMIFHRGHGQGPRNRQEVDQGPQSVRAHWFEHLLL